MKLHYVIKKLSFPCFEHLAMWWEKEGEGEGGGRRGREGEGGKEEGGGWRGKEGGGRRMEGERGRREEGEGGLVAALFKVSPFLRINCILPFTQKV